MKLQTDSTSLSSNTQTHSPPKGSTNTATTTIPSANGSPKKVSPGLSRHLSDAADVSDFAKDSFKRMFQYLGIDKSETAQRELGLNWELKVQKDGIEVSTTMVKGSTWQAIKGITYALADKHVIRNLLIDDKRMGEFDDMFDYSKYLLNIDERTRVRRLAFKPIWPTSPRDFVVGTTWTELKNGSILIVSRSVPNVMGEESGYVRGNVQISGYMIQPQHSETHSNNDGSTSNTTTNKSEPPRSHFNKFKITLFTHT